PVAAASASSYAVGSGSTGGPVIAATTLSRTGVTSPDGAHRTNVRWTARRAPASDTVTDTPRGPHELPALRLSSATGTESVTSALAPGASGPPRSSLVTPMPTRPSTPVVAQLSSAERVASARPSMPSATAG